MQVVTGRPFLAFNPHLINGQMEYNSKSPCTISQKENKKEREASIRSLATADLVYNPVEKAAHALREAELLRLQRQNLVLISAPLNQARCKCSDRRALTGIIINIIAHTITSSPSGLSIVHTYSSRSTSDAGWGPNHIS